MLHAFQLGTRMQILQINAYDEGGGAETVAKNLQREYRAAGHDAWMAVGFRRSQDRHVVEIPNAQSRSALWQFCYRLEDAAVRRKIPAVPGLAKWLSKLDPAERERVLNRNNGGEDFYHPSTARILELAPRKPEIVHCHNLHVNYFDLRLLPWLTSQAPVIFTLHDAWLLSGHCAHSFDCERWKTGCGECPDLTISPAIAKDATAANWKLKAGIFAGCRLRVATPSQWLMDKVSQSMLQPAIVESRVIPNGVDLSIYKPGDRQKARMELGIALDAKVLLFTSNWARNSPWRDFKTLQDAVGLIAAKMNGAKIVFLALGEDAPSENVGQARIDFVPYQKDPAIVAKYYQAADIYLHATRTDTFPNVILESQACGCPVVATGVGGIPEQIENRKTGFIVKAAAAAEMADCAVELLRNDALRHSIREAALSKIRLHNDWKDVAGRYLSWFEEITAGDNRGVSAAKILNV